VSPDQRIDQLLSEGVHLHLDLRLRRYAEESLLICERRYIELASFTLFEYRTQHMRKICANIPRPSWTSNQRPPTQTRRHPVTPTSSPHTLPPRALHLKLVYSFRLRPQVTLLCLFDLRMSAVLRTPTKMRSQSPQGHPSLPAHLSSSNFIDTYQMMYPPTVPLLPTFPPIHSLSHGEYGCRYLGADIMVNICPPPPIHIATDITASIATNIDA